MDTKKIVMKLCSGSYNNNDAINKVIGYISTDEHKPVPINGYGFFPTTADNAINSFQSVDNFMSEFYPDDVRKLWHFVISFDNSFDYNQVLTIAKRLSDRLYNYGYYTFYGIHHLNSKDDSSNRGYHIHFAIQYFSYDIYILPLYPYLLKEILDKFAITLESDYRNHLISTYKTTDLSSFSLVEVKRCF